MSTFEEVEETLQVGDVEEVGDIKENKDRQFSKNSIVNTARRAGIKCISGDGIDAIKDILNEKIEELSVKLSHFYNTKNSKTITKQFVLSFLSSEGILLTCKDNE